MRASHRHGGGQIDWSGTPYHTRMMREKTKPPPCQCGFIAKLRHFICFLAPPPILIAFDCPSMPTATSCPVCQNACVFHSTLKTRAAEVASDGSVIVHTLTRMSLVRLLDTQCWALREHLLLLRTLYYAIAEMALSAELRPTASAPLPKPPLPSHPEIVGSLFYLEDHANSSDLPAQVWVKLLENFTSKTLCFKRLNLCDRGSGGGHAVLYLR